MLKNYLRPKQAAEYLTNKTGDKYVCSDIKDMAAEGLLNVLVYFVGGVTEFEYLDCDEGTDIRDRMLIIHPFEGYLTSRDLIPFLDCEGMHPVPYPIDVFHSVAAKYWGVDLLCGMFPTSQKRNATLLDTDNWPAMFDADNDLYIYRDQLDRLIAKNTASSTKSIANQLPNTAEPIATLQATKHCNLPPVQVIATPKKTDQRELASYHKFINILLFECKIDVTHPHQAAELLDTIAISNGIPSLDRKTFVKIIEQSKLSRIKTT